MSAWYYYWPKLVAGLWFAFFNCYMMHHALHESKKKLAFRFVVYFFISSAFLSVVGEELSYLLYSAVYGLFGVNIYSPLVFVPYVIAFDAMMVFLGGHVYSKFTGLNEFVGAAIYMEYVCVERLTMVVSTDTWNYLIVYAIFQIILYLAQRKDLDFIIMNRTIQWRRIFVYLVGLFFILDLLYAAYFLFPQLAADLLEIKYAVWLDSIAIISSGFIIGYMKLSFSEAKQVEKKMNYFKKLQNSQEDIIISLAEITEAKSGETGQHIRRVAEYSRILGMRILKDVAESEQLRIAAMMHDLGKLLIDQNILEKKGKLTEEEYEIVKRHSQFGWNLLEHSKGEVMEMARVIALQHHEKWDGSGYPRGLRGNEISIYAQIVAVADVYDALTSKRSYKDAWAASDAKQEIIDQRGEQFSPVVVDAFLACYGDIERIRVRYMDQV